MVGHADDLMRHHLTNGKHQIISGIHDQAVDFYVNGIMPEPFGDLFQIGGGHFAQLYNIRAPVVDQEPVMGNVSKHQIHLFFRYGHMGAQSGENIHLHTGVG